MNDLQFVTGMTAVPLNQPYQCTGVFQPYPEHQPPESARTTEAGNSAGQQSEPDICNDCRNLDFIEFLRHQIVERYAYLAGECDTLEWLEGQLDEYEEI